MHWITTFRAKLILTLFPVVAVVTVVTLLMAERKFSATYRRLFDEQFEAFGLVLLACDVRWSFVVFVFVIDIGAFIDDEALHLGHFTSFNPFP
jgi:EamA domain-containing membrane protein RarD